MRQFISRGSLTHMRRFIARSGAAVMRRICVEFITADELTHMERKNLFNILQKRGSLLVKIILE